MKQEIKQAIGKIKEAKNFMKEQKELKERFKSELEIKQHNEYNELGTIKISDMTAKQYARYQVLTKKFAKGEELGESIILYTKMSESN